MPIDLRKYLEEKGVKAEFYTFEEHTRTVEAAAERLGVDPSVIIKTLVLLDERGGSVVAIIPGDRLLDEAAAAQAVGAKALRMAKAREVRSLTGYEVGALPPIVHWGSGKVLVDPLVLARGEVVGGGGSVNSLLKIRAEDLVRLNGAIVRSISR